MNHTDDEGLAALIRRTNELLSVLVRKALADVLEAELSNSKYRELYRLTGGELPVKAISQKVGLAVGTISETWQRWVDVGLLIKDGHRYRRVVG